MSIQSSVSRIVAVETANPPNRLTQEEALMVVKNYLKPSERVLHLYERFLADKGIKYRYFSWDDPQTLIHESVDEKMARFEKSAVTLSVEAAVKVLKQTNMAPQDIKAVFVCTCTGYLCPGLSTYVSEALGLAQDVYTLDLVGLGCTGALPTLKAADDYLRSHPDSDVLVIAVEICSAATHWGEKVDLILSNAIFSDGAAAVLLSNRPKVRGLVIQEITSILWPKLRNELRFKYMDSRLCNVISSKVPDIVSKAITLLHQQDGRISDYYAFHSGGRKVLDAVEEAIHLPSAKMAFSRQVLESYGNMSSPSVLFVLKEILKEPLKEGQAVNCFAYGAGFLAYRLKAQWQAI